MNGNNPVTRFPLPYRFNRSLIMLRTDSPFFEIVDIILPLSHFLKFHTFRFQRRTPLKRPEAFLFFSFSSFLVSGCHCSRANQVAKQDFQMLLLPIPPNIPGIPKSHLDPSVASALASSGNHSPTWRHPSPYNQRRQQLPSSRRTCQ